MAEQVNEYVPNSHLVEQFETVIDALVYELYFEDDFRAAEISFLKYATRDFPSIEKLETPEKIEVIHNSYQKLTNAAGEAINVRTNHAHAVVSAQMKPERIADAFKAFATKKLREENLVNKELKIWSRGRSRRYLWKPRHVELAINYVLYGQGDIPFEIDD